MKLALFFENRVRSDTTGMYFLQAAAKEGLEVQHFIPGSDKELIPGSHDLYLKIDDGIKQYSEWNESLQPSAYYCIDTHMPDAEWRDPVVAQFNATFCAQHDGALKYKSMGHTAEWLPLGCDPDIHVRQYDCETKFDWAHVGNAWPKRIEYLDALLKEFPNGIYSRQVIFQQMARVYSQSRIVFNNSFNNDINMRFFEALASGSFQICEKVEGNGWAKLGLGDFVDTFSYSEGQHELIDRFKKWLDPANEERRKQIAKEGMEEVLSRHTYWHRLQNIFRHFGLKP